MTIVDGNSGESVRGGSPDFVKLAEFRHNALAAGFIRGRDVLDVGSGDCMLFQILKASPDIKYTAVDKYRPSHIEDDSRFHFIEEDIIEWLKKAVERGNHYDTVVAMEVLEHIDPGRQEWFLANLWKITDRLILSTPNPEAYRHYPSTGIFYGPNNPYHLRELPEWLTLSYIMRSCPHAVLAARLHSHIEVGDEMVWGGLAWPSNYLLVLDRVK